MKYRYDFKCAVCQKTFMRDLDLPDQPAKDDRKCWQWQRERGPVDGQRETGCTGAVRWTWKPPQQVVAVAIPNEAVQLATAAASQAWQVLLRPINQQVRTWRSLKPNNTNINAGQNTGIGECYGGEQNQLELTIPVQCTQAGVSGITIAKACATLLGTNWSFDPYSNAGTYKFRVKHAGWRDVMIHVKFK